MAVQIGQRVCVKSSQVIIMMTSKAKPWIALQMAHEIKLMMFVYYIYIADLPTMLSVVVVVSWVKEQVWKGWRHGFESQ